MATSKIVKRMIVGTWPRPYKSHIEQSALGISVLDVGIRSPLLSAHSSVATEAPGWVAIHPDLTSVYATNEVSEVDGRPGGSVTSFRVSGEGELVETSRSPTGAAPAFCVVDPTGGYLLVAAYSGATIHSFRLADDGSIDREVERRTYSGCSVHPKRQSQSRPHGITFSPDGEHIIVPDLGADRIFWYRFNSGTGKLDASEMDEVRAEPGSGPRHAVFHPVLNCFYVVNELVATVTRFDFERPGRLSRLVQTCDLLPAGFDGYRSAAELLFHPNGRTLYVTTRSRGSSEAPTIRGIDSVVVFDVDEGTGSLRFRTRVDSGGVIPRSLAFDPDENRLFVAHQGSENIVIYDIDDVTGVPERALDSFDTPVPVCLQLIPDVGWIEPARLVR